MSYKHGAYGQYADSISNVGIKSQTIPVYIGTAPVNLVRGYKDYVNAPVKLSSYGDVKRYMGDCPDSAEWSKFSLCEAFWLHFNNENGNAAPIVVINVLNPDVHRKESQTTVSLTFTNGRATIKSNTIILDTLVLGNKVEGTDFSIDYDFTKGQVIINSIGTAISGSVSATYYEVSTTVNDLEVIGGVTNAGVYTGLGCVELVYPELGVIPNFLVAPRFSESKDVYKAMVKAAKKINGHWDAVVLADIPVDSPAHSTGSIEEAITWKNLNDYNDEISKVFYPHSLSSDGTKLLHKSALWAWKSMQVDASHNGVPMETASNKSIPVSCNYFGTNSTNRGFDQTRANDLNKEGITTAIYWGGQWVLWGPHTAAYSYGNVSDNKIIFDTSIRMMMHVSNSFQAEHGLTIDSPMTRAKADTIKNREQEKADALAAMGAFIGEPVVRFDAESNDLSEMVEGNFVWDFKGTPTPPWKSGTLTVAYTDAGFSTFIEGGAE